MERLLRIISAANGVNSGSFHDLVLVLERTLSVARATRNTVACAGKCQFCLLMPEIIRCEPCVVIERRISWSSDLAYSIIERIQINSDCMMKGRESFCSIRQLDIETLARDCRTLKVLLQVSVRVQIHDSNA